MPVPHVWLAKKACLACSHIGGAAAQTCGITGRRRPLRQWCCQQRRWHSSPHVYMLLPAILLPMHHMHHMCDPRTTATRHLNQSILPPCPRTLTNARKHACTHSGEEQDICSKLAIVCNQSNAHVGYSAGVAVPHLPSRNSGQILHSYLKSMCIPLAYRNTEAKTSRRRTSPMRHATSAGVPTCDMAGRRILPNASRDNGTK